MPKHPWKLTAVLGLSVLASPLVFAQYSLTVNKDRLANAANEPADLKTR